MAYFRGDIYIWSDGDDLHLWSREGMDGWESWQMDDKGKPRLGWENASGVSIPEEVIEQLVMMRLAEILVSESPEKVDELIDQAVTVGNFGSDCLRANAQELKAAFRALKMEKPEPN